MPQYDTKDFKANEDGSFIIMADSKPLRLVKESDLLAVKGGFDEAKKAHESAVADWTGKLAEAQKRFESEHQGVIQGQAALEQLSGKLKDHDTLTAKVGELTKEVDSHKQRLTGYEKDLVTRITNQLISLGAKAESLKDKTLDQLKSLEEAAGVFGQKKPSFDGGGGGNGSKPETDYDRRARIIAESEERRGKPTLVANK